MDSSYVEGSSIKILRGEDNWKWNNEPLHRLSGKLGYSILHEEVA